jgi:phosphonopyruvate decarboxylase
MVGSMGCATSLGLGLSLALPQQRVVVVDGDGAALMRMGNFATIGAHAAENFQPVLVSS